MIQKDWYNIIGNLLEDMCGFERKVEAKKEVGFLKKSFPRRSHKYCICFLVGFFKNDLIIEKHIIVRDCDVDCEGVMNV